MKLLYSVSHLNTRLEQCEDGRIDLYLEGAATFLRLPKLAGVLERLPEARELHVHCDRLVYVDHSCLDLLHHWHDQHTKSGRPVVLEWDGLLQRFERPMSAASQVAA